MEKIPDDVNVSSTCEEQLLKVQEKLTYLTADFENYRRHMEKERIHMFESGQRSLLLDVLAFVDDFERFYHDATSQAIPSELSQRFMGLELVNKSLQKLLQRYQITEITSVNIFDPYLHEAVMQVADSDKESGAIVAVLQKGYLHRGVVVRPAKVSVAQ